MSEQDFKQFQQQFSQLTRLAAAQLIVAVNDADDSMNELSGSFTEIVQKVEQLQVIIKQWQEQPEFSVTKDNLETISTSMNSKIQSAIVAFQFFDRMSQRLEHTILCLKELSVVEENDLASLNEQLQQLTNKIYHSFTMEEERILYDQILKHSDFEAALKQYRNAAKRDDEDIELF